MSNTTKKTKRTYRKTGKYSKRGTAGTTEAINYKQLSNAFTAFGILSPTERNLVVAVTKIFN